ncbi:hypothetical protein [Oscillatoria sp. FACHB-1407]|nr:hypothetical protein [Oscillatoria sp. FACHB-1407]
MVRKLRIKAMAQTLMLGKLPDSPPPHQMSLRLMSESVAQTV